jgi:hypothetical protein
MKTLLNCIFFSLLCSFAYAQSPNGINYQAVLRDDAGNCLTSADDVDFTFSIEDGGSVIFEEEHSNVKPSDQGVVQIVIGSRRPNDFNNIDWTKSYQLLVEYKVNNGATETLGPIDFLSVPYAFYANSANVAGNGKLRDANGAEELILSRSNGGDYIFLGSVPGNTNLGFIRVLDNDGNSGVSMAAQPTGNGDAAGRIVVSGSAGNPMVELAWDETATNTSDRSYTSHGRISVKNADGNDMVRIKSENMIGNGVGQVWVLGDNGRLNVALANESTAHPNNGSVTIHDANGLRKGRLYVRPDGTSTIEVDDKAFVIDYPGKADKEIVYISLEGPEAGAYERGTATLKNGEAFIEFSETFGLVINPETLTIMTSPWSAKSKGLAIVERSAKGFKVKELKGGKGDYKFDWEVKGVRKGYEDFSPVRAKETSN